MLSRPWLWSIVSTALARGPAAEEPAEWHRAVAPGVEVGEITTRGLALSRPRRGFESLGPPYFLPALLLPGERGRGVATCPDVRGLPAMHGFEYSEVLGRDRRAGTQAGYMARAGHTGSW